MKLVIYSLMFLVCSLSACSIYKISNNSAEVKKFFVEMNSEDSIIMRSFIQKQLPQQKIDSFDIKLSDSSILFEFYILPNKSSKQISQLINHHTKDQSFKILKISPFRIDTIYFSNSTGVMKNSFIKRGYFGIITLHEYKMD